MTYKLIDNKGIEHIMFAKEHNASTTTTATVNKIIAGNSVKEIKTNLIKWIDNWDGIQAYSDIICDAITSMKKIDNSIDEIKLLDKIMDYFYNKSK